MSGIEYQRMMSVYKKAVRQTEQIRWKIQIHKYKIRSEYTEFHTDQIENMFTKAPPKKLQLQQAFN